MCPLEVMTHKAGKFVFSAEYDEKIITPLLVEAKILYQTVADLPILPSWSARLNVDVIRRSIFSTAAIEGNVLSEEEVGRLIEERDENQLRLKAEREILNLVRLYDGLNSSGGEMGAVYLLTERDIRGFHRLIAKGLDEPENTPGNYRNHLVKVGDKAHGGVFTPPKALDDIRLLMVNFVRWMNSEDVKNLDVSIRAALAHYYFATIHPFGDGNGRTARYIEAIILDKFGIKYIPKMLSNYYYRNIDDYFISFSETHAQKEDVTPFLKFFFEGFISSITEIKESVFFHIRFLALKDYYELLKNDRELTKRQYELMLILLEHAVVFSQHKLFADPALRSLYANVSETTARRDIRKLSNLGLIEPVLGGKNEYRCDMRALG